MARNANVQPVTVPVENPIVTALGVVDVDETAQAENAPLVDPIDEIARAAIALEFLGEDASEEEIADYWLNGGPDAKEIADWRADHVWDAKSLTVPLTHAVIKQALASLKPAPTMGYTVKLATGTQDGKPCEHVMVSYANGPATSDVSDALEALRAGYVVTKDIIRKGGEIPKGDVIALGASLGRIIPQRSEMDAETAAIVARATGGTKSKPVCPVTGRDDLAMTGAKIHQVSIRPNGEIVLFVRFATRAPQPEAYAMLRATGDGQWFSAMLSPEIIERANAKGAEGYRATVGGLIRDPKSTTERTLNGEIVGESDDDDATDDDGQE